MPGPRRPPLGVRTVSTPAGEQPKEPSRGHPALPSAAAKYAGPVQELRQSTVQITLDDPASREAIERAEAELGFQLPAEYVAFLLENNVARDRWETRDGPRFMCNG